MGAEHIGGVLEWLENMHHVGEGQPVVEADAELLCAG